jgi:hypothetical protein
MVLAQVRSDVVRFGRGRKRSPTLGGVRCPSALAIEANGQTVPAIERLRRDSALSPRTLERPPVAAPESGVAAAPQPQERVELAHTE